MRECLVSVRCLFDLLTGIRRPVQLQPTSSLPAPTSKQYSTVVAMLASTLLPLAALLHTATAGVVSARLASDRLTSKNLARRQGGSSIPPIQDGSGKATFFSGWDGGNCAYQGWNPSEAGLSGIAIGAPIWDNSLHCGGCVEISYNGSPPQTAMVSEHCFPE